MNKKIVTLACVTLLSSFVGVNADELSLGGSVDSKEDTAGLVVAEQPKEEKPAVVPAIQNEGENLDLGGKTEKEPSQDNTGVVVEPTTPSEQPKENQPKEEKPSENLGKDSEKEPSNDNTGVVVEPTTPSDKPKEDQPKADTQKEADSKVQEDKKKAEDNVGVKESDDPKPLNVTKEDIQEQKDGTIALKDKEGQLKVLPNTGSVGSIFVSILGVIGLIATVIGKRKLK